MKLCRDCGTDRPLEAFGLRRASPDGRAAYCKECFRVRHRQQREARAAREGRPLVPRRSAPPGQKWCPDCAAFYDKDDFPRNRSAADGLGAYCKPCHNRRARESRDRLHGGSRHYHLVRRYGISAAEVDALIARQGGVCAICLRHLGQSPHLDHDHATGEVRAVLCFGCNGGLGLFGDDISRLTAAITYLRFFTPTDSVVERRVRRLIPVPRVDPRADPAGRDASVAPGQ